MSKYLTAGWEKFPFIVTPSELEPLINDMHLLVTNHHVPNGYRETPLQEYIADYSKIYTMLASGQQLAGGDKLFTEIGFAQSLENHAYGRLHTYQGASYLLQDFDEPCAIIQYFPMYLYATENDRITLTISASTSQFPENTVGLSLLYPKQIQYPCGLNYLPLQSTKDLTSYQDYLIVRDRIKAITRPLRLMVMGKEIRPRVRVSQYALADIEKFWFFQNNAIEVIL